MKPYFEDEAVTIYHGDCRDILPQLGPVDLVLTDPPYGVGRRYGASYDDSRATYWDWFRPCVDDVLRPAGTVLAMTHRLEALRQLPTWDWVACWHKPYGAGARIGTSPLLPHWEPILMWGIHTLGTKRDSLPDVITVNPERSPSPVRLKSNGRIQHGSRDQAYERDTDTAEHPLPKPIALMKRLVAGLSSEGQTVLDPFMGSGTTLRAAKDLGRKAIGIEIEERYCEIAAKRMAQGVLV